MSTKDNKQLEKNIYKVTKKLSKKRETKVTYMTKQELINKSAELTKMENRDVRTYAKFVNHFLITGCMNVEEFFKKTIQLLLIGGPTVAFCIGLVIGVLLYLVTIIPCALLVKVMDKVIDKHQNQLLIDMAKNDKNLAAYYELTRNIKRGKIKIIEESVYCDNQLWSVVTEAPDDTVEDGATDYTEDVDDTPEETDDEATETEEDTPEETTDDEAIDDDTTDYTEDVDDTPEEEPTEPTGEEDAEDTTATDGTEDTDDTTEEEDTATDDDVMDYTDEAGAEDETADDTTDDTTEDDTETDDTEEDTEDTEQTENSNVKNYNLMLDYKKLYTSVSHILQNLSDVIYPETIQNQVVYRVIDNLQNIREQILNYIDLNFSNKYEDNLYHYNIFIQSMRLNLEMLRKNDDLCNTNKKH